MNSKVSPITPTVGRVVLVRGGAVRADDPVREFPALVTKVWGQNCINVDVSNEEPGGKLVTSVFFDDSDERLLYAGWRWMPYQVQVAKERDVVSGEKSQLVGGALGPKQDLKQDAIGVPPIQSFVERLVIEAAEVGARLNKLKEFLPTAAFCALGEQHKFLLKRQYDVMLAYTEVLAERILLAQTEA